MRTVVLSAMLACASLLAAQDAPKPDPADDRPAGPRPSFEIADVRLAHARLRNTPL